MALFVDKHRPKSLGQLSFHPELTERLRKMVGAGDFPHLLLYGPSGAGKKTRVAAVLREVFGAGVDKVRIEQRRFTPPKGKALELTTLASAHHIEMNPSDAGGQDRAVIQEVIKEMAASVPLDSSVPFKVIVLLEVDSLSKGAQHALRRTMEKYGGTCRLILCSSSTGRLLEPVRSRCLCLRVPAPSQEVLAALIEKVAKNEQIQLGPGLALRLAKECDRNARRALLALEALRVRAGPNLASDLVIPRADWEEAVETIGKMILEEQSPARLLSVRARFYELLGHCIPADVILRRLLEFLLRRVDSSLRPHLIEVAASYDQRLRAGSKPIFHLEAFVARFMAVYKQFLASMVFD